MARLHREVLKVLIGEIVAGEREPGTQLPREADLVEEFGVSRGVVREFIRALEERGLVSVKHGRGATVTPPSSWDMLDADVLAAILDSPQGGKALGEYLECRQILEIEAAGLAAERASEEDVQRLTGAMDALEAAAARPASRAAEDAFHQADLEFHRVLIRATGNRSLSSLIEHIHRALLAARYPTARPELRQERALPEHRAILKAVAAGNRNAARRAMTRHLETIAGYLREYVEGQSSAQRSGTLEA
jgi:GntR family transcriptional repressor for pyruvate dehydrogenase complex